MTDTDGTNDVTINKTTVRLLVKWLFELLSAVLALFAGVHVISVEAFLGFVAFRFALRTMHSFWEFLEWA